MVGTVINLDQGFLNYKHHMSVKELQTCVGLLKKNYELHPFPFTLEQMCELLSLLMAKDPDKKEEYINDLLEVKMEQEHTIFNNYQPYAAKIDTQCLTDEVSDYVEHCIPSTNYNSLDLYDFPSP